MSDLTIPLESALDQRDKGALFIDVRTPAEYAEATIPGAVNIPIFSNEERARVGTVYKKEGQLTARRLGVELVSPRIPAMVDAVAKARGNSNQPVIVFCWRGGMRSRALASFLNLAGIPALQLIGGHKAFRTYVLNFFEEANWGRILVLRGLTGVGKTHLLLQLKREGYPVIDLEGLANHRGSAFGSLGLGSQPGQKAFEARLWDALRHVPSQGYALAEGESRNIGKVALPLKVYESLQKETTLWVNASLDYRTKIILKDYPARDELKEAFAAPIQALKRRLGAAVVNNFLSLLENGQWDELVRELMVRYYDPLYNHTKPQRRIEIDIEPEQEGFKRLKEAIKKVLEAPPC